MNGFPKISDTEWEIMRVVWAHHPITATDIVTKLCAVDSTWHPKTARTLLARLVDKGALDYEMHGRSYVYEPRVAEEDCISAASGSFVERVFGGSLKPMFLHFVERHTLTSSDLDELRAILDGARTKRRPVRKQKRPRR